MTASRLVAMYSRAPHRIVIAGPEQGHRLKSFEKRTTCPSCGLSLVTGKGWERWEHPGHYAHATMSEQATGEDLRDEHGVASGLLPNDRHSQTNPSGLKR
jgi:hypothetical protein